MNNNINKNIFLFVENFSSDNHEEFFEKELPFLCDHFESVKIIPLYKQKVELNYHHSRIEILNIDLFSGTNRILTFINNFSFIISVFVFEFMKTHHKSYYLLHFRSMLNLLIIRVGSLKNIEYLLVKEGANSIFYSYWFNQWAFTLSLLKKKHPFLKIVTRAHGSDYKEEQTNTVLPFRYFQIDQMNRIIPVSEYGQNYLITKFKAAMSKLMISRLGINKISNIAPIDCNYLTLVSCSSVIPLKRVALIVNILKHLNIPTRWEHFGTGPLAENLNQLIKQLPSNITVHLNGYVPNEDYLHFLDTTPVSFFINVSEYEGIPVTLMEAAGRGIPIIGCKTGGVPEIVNETTGILLDVQFRPENVASIILQKHKEQNIYSTSFRKSIQEFSQTYFDSNKNHEKLILNLLIL